MCSTIESTPVDIQERKNTANLKCSLVFFVFFDGTNNNKVQVAKSRTFRDKTILENINKLLKSEKVFNGGEFPSDRLKRLQNKDFITDNTILNVKLGYRLKDNVTANDIRKLGRSFWTGVLSNDDVDALFFGYEEQQNGTYADYVGKNIEFDAEINKNVDESYSYTNIAILEMLFCKKDSNSNIYIPLYIEGSGTASTESDGNAVFHGQGRGRGDQGVCAKLNTMIKLIKEKIAEKCFYYDIESIDYYVFGFSRGATTARMFTHLATVELDTNGFPTKKLEGKSNDISALTEEGHNKFHFKKSLSTTKISVKFLGLYDTVASITLNLTDSNYTNNVKDYFLYSTDKAEYTFHLTAIDEYRKNFGLVDIQSSLDSKKGTEIFIPGCHTDIGGGRAIKDNSRTNKFINKSLWTSNVHSNSIKYKKLPNDKQEAMAFLTNDIGWAKQVDDVRIGYDSVFIRRNIISGYSNIGLSLMAESVNSRLAAAFTTVENTPYKLPTDLTCVKEDISKKCNANGRWFLYPSQTDYAKLRAKYLQLSCDDFIVNSPSFKTIKTDDTTHQLLIRLVTTGLQSSQLQYMCDYSGASFQEISGIR